MCNKCRDIEGADAITAMPGWLVLNLSARLFSSETRFGTMPTRANTGSAP